MGELKKILGTMTFGPQVCLDDSIRMVEQFLSAGHCELDTAYVYNNGDSEKFLGMACKQLYGFSPSIATKANPKVSGKLDRESITAQLYESLKRLQCDYVDTFYLHFPDPLTPLEETLSACAELHQKGYFKELGLSNYAAWEVVHIWHLCRKNGWPVPTVYQGLYNGLSRRVEGELIPALRTLGMRFYAYNPLAGGILAGKYSDYGSEPIPGRFTHRPNYKERYWKKEFFQALNILHRACEKNGITMVEAAFRWLAEHSALDASVGDGILIGVSSPAQLIQNLGIVGRGPLPQKIVDAFSEAWIEIQPKSPAYFRAP